ncbi:MAG: type IV toxin-antitoxin system AbiEi family antitoxin domain-containing protein [Egibacteraceae bacterium]
MDEPSHSPTPQPPPRRPSTDRPTQPPPRPSSTDRPTQPPPRRSSTDRPPQPPTRRSSQPGGQGPASTERERAEAHAARATARGASASRQAQAALRKAAAGQDGQFATAQARELGVSRSALRTLRERGEIVGLRRGVWRFRAASGEPAPEMTAYLACWPDGVVSHESAARLHGLEVCEAAAAVHVTVPHARRRAPAGVIVHLSRRLPSADVLADRGLRLTSLARTLCDLAATGPAGQTLRLLDAAVALGAAPKWIHQRASELTAGRPGVATLRAATDPGGAPVFRSWLERTLAELVATAGLPAPEWNVEVEDAAGRIGIVDALWREAGVIAEAEGLRFHTSAEARRRDAERFNRLAAAGYTARRFTWHDVVDEPERVVATLAEALRDAADASPATGSTGGR